MAKDRKYGKLPISNSKIPTAEPVFILRAQDRLAEPIIRHYAEIVLAHTGNVDQYRSILASAENFALWPTKKIPD